MGTFKWPLRISSMDGRQSQDIEAVVGTGAFYTTLPVSLLRSLGIEPRGKRRVPQAGGRGDRSGLRAGVGFGRRQERDYPGRIRGGDSQALLGIYTLDALALEWVPSNSG